VIEFFDTNVMVAAFLSSHEHHENSRLRIKDLSPERSYCAAHSLAEVYAVTTRLPRRPTVPPEDVFLFLQDIQARLTPVTLDAPDYLAVLAQLRNDRFTGGRVYDALLLHCARKANAQRIYTFNLRDFQRLAPDLADRMSTP